jgi:hypothetical protein
LLLKVSFRNGNVFRATSMNALGRFSFGSRLGAGAWVGMAGAVVFAAGCAAHGSVSSSPATASDPPAVHAATEAAPSPDLGERPRHIMAVHHSKCGACHTPVEPGTVPRGEAEAAMRRHRKRAKLSEREWNDMVEYISDDGDLRGRPTARLP